MAQLLYDYRIGRFGKVHEIFDILDSVAQSVTNERRATLDHDQPRDYVDSYLIEHDKRKERHGQVGSFDGE